MATVPLVQQSDLMSQINREVARLRCHQVWGGRCQTWVSAPSWGHGSHQAYHKLTPDTIQRLPDPDFVLQRFELDKSQSGALARNPRLSFNGLCTLLQGPHGESVSFARTNAWSKWSGKPGNTAQDCTLEPGGWTDERWAKLIAVWPTSGSLSTWMRWAPRDIWRKLVHDPVRAREVRQLARAVYAPGARLLDLIAVGERDRWPDPVWADIWQGTYPIRSNPSLYLRALEHLKQAGPREMAKLSIISAPTTSNPGLSQKQWILTLHEALMRNMDAPGVTDAHILQVAQRLAIEQDDSLDTPRFWSTVIAPRLSGDGSIHNTLIRAVAKRPDAPPEAKLAAARWATTDLQRVQSMPATVWDAATIQAVYEDRQIRARMPEAVRRQLLAQPQCPPSVLATEARSKIASIRRQAIKHPDCPSDVLLRVWANQGESMHPFDRQILLEHPNMPEEYRALAQLA